MPRVSPAPITRRHRWRARLGGLFAAGLAPAASAATLAVALLAAPTPAHEEGVIRLGSPTASPGEEIEIRGERLPRATMLRIELRGALASYPLGEVRSDAAGAFVTRLALPAEVDPARYRVVALAPDGDIVARADLVVVATPPAEIVPATPVQPVHPTGARMELPSTRMAGEWVAVLTLIVVAAGGGLVLLRRSRRHP